MKTSKPIATIAYQSDDFLIDKLEELRKAHKIEFWAYVNHKAEEDEKTDHKHLFIKPAVLLQTMDLQDFLLEANLVSGKPNKCLNFENSSPLDWILYCLHYPPYLDTKRHQTRVFQYGIDEFITSDTDELDELYRKAMLWFSSEYGINQRIYEMVKQGFDRNEILLNLNIKPQYALGFTRMIDAALTLHTQRGGRKGHGDPED